MAEISLSSLVENHDTLCHKCGKCHKPELCLIQEIDYYIDKYANQATFLKEIDFNLFFQYKTNVYIEIYISEQISIYFFKTTYIFGFEFLKNTNLDMFIRSYNLLEILQEDLENYTNEWHRYIDNWELNSADSYEYIYPDSDNDNDNMDLDDNSLLDQSMFDNTNNIKKCPLCRTDNTLNECIEIKGLEEKCKICLDNPVEYLFSKCKHACVCKECFTKI